MATLLWEPPDELVERALMTRYMRWLDRGFGSYDELWRWSVEDLEGFWASIWTFFEVDSDYEQVLAERTMPGASWFPGAQLNYAEHAFRGKDDGALAIVHASELREQAELTWGELREQVRGIAAGLRALGVRAAATASAGYMPNIPEAIAAFLATASLGAVWSSCSPDFGARSVIDRFAQIEPKVLLAVDGYRYNGRDFDRADVVAGIHEEVGGTLVRLGYLDGSGWEEGFLGDDELTLRARAVRPPAVGPVLLRHRPGCRRRSSRARAGSCSSTSRSCTCTSTCRRATGCSGSRRRAG